MEPEHNSGTGVTPGSVPEKKPEAVKGLIAAAKESAEEGLIPKWLLPLLKWGKREWSGIKAGRSLFIVLALAIFALSAWLVHKYDNTTIQSLNSQYTSSNSFLLGMIAQDEKEKSASEKKIQDLKSDINRLTTEKTSAETRLTTLETFSSQYPAFITNISALIETQPTNRQQILNLQLSVEALTNALAEATLRPTFDLSINTIPIKNYPLLSIAKDFSLITNCTVLNLHKSRKLDIRVRNTSPLTVEQLTVSMNGAFDPTNVIATGWRQLPPYLAGGQTGNGWSWQANTLLNANGIYDVEQLEISSNYTNPAVPIKIEVSAPRSKTIQFMVVLLFQ
jgi:hypothetical protein